MTQNPYQQGPPPGYGQPQPGQYAPYGSPAAQPQAPNPFTQPGQAGPPPAGDDPFGAPGAPVGGSSDGPALHQLEGRLLLIRPISYDPSSPGYKGGDPGPMARADIVVCDGPPIAGNLDGTTNQMTPFAGGPKQAPFYVGGMYIRGKVLPGQLEGYVSGRGFCLGRVVKGNPGSTGKPPWILADPSEADKVIGRQVHAQWEQLKTSAAPPPAPQPDQFGAPQGQYPPAPVYDRQQAPPQPWQQQQQGPPPGYGQQPAYPPAPQGPPPGYGQQQAPAGYPPY